MSERIAVGLGLAAWTAIVVGFARAGERRALGSGDAVPLRTVALALASAVVAIACSATPELAAARGATCVSLVVAADADARTGYLFDAVTLPTAILTAVLGFVFGDAAASALGVIVLVVIFGTIVAASRGRALGLGDVKAMYSIGASFGPAGALIAVLGACLSGILGAAIAGSFRRGTSIRFGPHLALGSGLALIFGDTLVRALQSI